MLCVFMTILSHATAKQRQKGSKASNVAVLLAVFKCHRGSEGVKKTGIKKSYWDDTKVWSLADKVNRL